MYSALLYSGAIALSLAASVAANPQLSFPGSSKPADPAPKSSSSSPEPSSSHSTSSSSSVSSSSSTYVAPKSSSTSVYVAPSSSSSSTYIPKSSSTSVYVAPTSSSTPVYVPPKSSWTSKHSSHHYTKSSSAATASGTPTVESLEADAAKKVAEARLIPTVAERIALLENSEYEFDFVDAITGVTTGTAGHSVTASSLNFPALVGTGMSMTIGFLGPCGLNTPHTHPRGTELNYVVNGTLRTGFLMENGARFVFNEAHAGTVSVFPAGAIHFEQNNGCDPVMFVAAFNHEDAGVTAVAQRFFGLPPDIVGADLGGLTDEEVAEIVVKIPNNIALGADECLQRCGITRPSLQETSQQQGRNPGNALPSGFSSVSEAADLYPSTGIRFAEGTGGPKAPPKSVAAPTPSSASSYSYAAPASSKAAGALAALGDESSGSTTFATSPILIALVVVNGVFVIAALAAMVVCLRRRSGGGDKRGKYVQPSAYKPGMVEHQEYEDVPYSGTK